MSNPVIVSLRALAAFTLLTGVAYPALVTSVAQVFFPAQANGSLVREGGAVRGSSLIGQPFSSAGYFWGRPSATSPPYHAGASSGSNQGPSNPALAAAVKERIAALAAAGHVPEGPVPVDLVTASGSGLDPDVSPAAALYQVPRVAAARGIPEARARALVTAHVQGRYLGVLGEARVNVLALNLALDQVAPLRSGVVTSSVR